MASEKPQSAACEFVSASDSDEPHAYICRKTGRIFFVSDGLDPEEDDLPDDLETSDQYQAAPHRRELDLGKPLALSFVRDELPGSRDKAREIFSRRGAYSRFKTLLRATGTLDKWYAYEQRAVEEALKEWCDDVDLPWVDD